MKKSIRICRCANARCGYDSAAGITGEIPAALGSLLQLKTLIPRGNALSGEKRPPQQSPQASRRFLFSVSRSQQRDRSLIRCIATNHIAGSISNTLVALPSLTTLDISSNQLTGA
jgi:hypothetical protein